MAFITLDRSKLKHNYTQLNTLFTSKNISWAVVGKILCGNEIFLKELLALKPKQICDSRVSNLISIKSIDPKIETIYIKPAPNGSIKEIVKYADISFNTELESIKLLSEEAVKQNKVHKIVVMVELGERREGVLRNDLIDFYETIIQLPNLEILGLGTNLTCMYGILPNNDKLIQLDLYKQLLELKFNSKISVLSGGASVTIPLILNNSLPAEINHFRIGESLFMGTNAYDGSSFNHLKQNVFKLHAEVIELHEKPMMPQGEVGTNMMGEKLTFNPNWEDTSNYRAIIDLGLLDIDIEHITPLDNNLEIVGGSSDMIVLDIGDNNDNIKVGDTIPFHMNYMGILRIMNSDYVDKKIV